MISNSRALFILVFYISFILSAKCFVAAKSRGTVLIIGSGPSGMAAATRLMANGFKVTILEAQNRYGGRINTVKYGASIVDLGAQWCHGQRDNAVYEIVRKYSLELLSSNTVRYDDTIFYRSGGGTIPPTMAQRLRDLGDGILHNPDLDEEMLYSNQSIGAFFMPRYKSALSEPQYSDINEEVSTEFLNNLEKYQSWAGAWDSWFNASSFDFKNYYHNDGDLLLNWRDKGYETIFQLLMNRMPGMQGPVIPADQHIMFNRTVVRIHWSEVLPQPIVECADGSRWTADHVISTVSVGVLQERIPRGFFQPPLPPRKLAAIDGLMMGAINKLFLEFEQLFWPEGWKGFSLTWSDADIQRLGSGNMWLTDVFAFYPVDFQPHLLNGIIVANGSRHMETLSEKEVQEGCLQLMRTFLNETGWRIPNPVSFLRTTWHSNPNFRGTWSAMTRRGDLIGAKREDLAAPLLRRSGVPIVQFAGEATHSHYYTTVHGSIATGWREADRLIGSR